MTDTNKSNAPGATRYVVVAIVLVVAFFGAYQFAQARGAAQTSGSTSTAQSAATVTGTGVGTGPEAAADGGTPACACCGTSAPTENGVTGEQVEGTAAESGGVQAISVDLSSGTYNPNVIKLKAGVPAEITFGQSSGCTGQVMSEELGFFEDLTAGPRTVKLPALQAGEYAFSCGMQMVFAKIVVE